MVTKPALRVAADHAAQAWLDAHPVAGPRVISYEVHRCCGGGKICSVRIRHGSDRDQPGKLLDAELDDGSVIRIDRRAAARLPARFGLTVRGFGPLKHLDLDLEPEQWGELLYD